ncbi:MAG: hypothetical protein ACFFFH_19740 [Candidatus Thorarchaeota archaeon]
MRKKYSFLITASLFLLVLVPTISLAEIDDSVMTPGDTFIYTVKDFDVPWEDLFGESDLMGYPIGNFVFDLSGSTFAVKVMGTDDSNGYYMLNPYVILGKDIEIPIPEESLTPQLEAVLGGDTLVIPEGVGLGMSDNIPGSDYLEFISANYEDDFPGIPFYFDANEWDQYKGMFDDLAGVIEGANPDLELTTDENNGEFIVTIEGSVGGGAQYTTYTTTEPYYTTGPYYTTPYPLPFGGPEMDGDILFEVAWFASGDHAGVFKRVKGSFDGDIGDISNVQMKVEASFDEKRYNPLPQEIRDEDTITLKMDSVTFTHDESGFFADNQDFQDQIGNMDNTLQDAEGQDMFVFDVRNVEGCYYETDIDVYEGESSNGVWWNGFIGAPGWKDDWMEGPWKDWYIYASGGNGIIPLAAPGITPDWDMWQASTLAISSILDFVENAVTSSDAEAALGDIGVTLNQFDVQFEMRGNKDYKFFYFTGKLDLAFDSTQYVDWPSEDPEEPKADAKVNVEAWIGYTADGLIVSIGVNLDLVANFVQFPFSSEYNYDTSSYETYYDDGTLEMKLNAEVVNNDINDIPDPDNLPKDTEGEEGGGGGLPTPGFSVIPALILVAAISVIIKRRK